MNEFTKILATIQRPFQQEIRSGCKDSVVINGLGAYVQLWVKNAEKLTLNPTEKQMLASLVNLFSNYEALSPTKRREVVEAATEQIEGIKSGNQQASPPKKNLRQQRRWMIFLYFNHRLANRRRYLLLRWGEPGRVEINKRFFLPLQKAVERQRRLNLLPSISPRILIHQNLTFHTLIRNLCLQKRWRLKMSLSQPIRRR